MNEIFGYWDFRPGQFSKSRLTRTWRGSNARVDRLREPTSMQKLSIRQGHRLSSSIAENGLRFY
jgi:hypothetical protein